jgi:two-component system CheB/CheR fusion protein
MAEKVLNLIPSDLDRPIGHIKPNIDCPELEQLILESIDSVAPIEREVRDQGGRWYSLRIRPYKNVENKIDGAVLTLFDVDVSKRSEQRMRLVKEYTDALMALIDQPILVLDGELRVQAVSDRFARVVGVAPSAITGRHVSEIGGSWNLGALQNRLRSLTGGNNEFERIPIDLDGDDGARRTVFLTGRWLQWHELPDTQVLVLALSGSEPGALSDES